MIAISRLSKTYTHRRHQKASEGITITITTLHRPTRGGGGAHTAAAHWLQRQSSVHRPCKLHCSVSVASDMRQSDRSDDAPSP